MPQAFSVAYGLDLDTELSSFWAWLHDARAALAGSDSGPAPVRELLRSQEDQIERIAAQQAHPEAARFALSVALALVGFHHASNQKLLNGLRDYGLLQLGSPPPVFDTIGEAPLEDGRPD